MKKCIVLFLLSMMCISQINSISLLKNTELFAQIPSDFPEINESFTCDEGVLINIDENEFYSERIINRSSYYYFPFNTVWKEVPGLKMVFNTGQNKKILARLNIKYVIPGVHEIYCFNSQTYAWAYTFIRMIFDDKEVDQHYYMIGRKIGHTWQDAILESTVFNVAPGVHTIKIEAQIIYPAGYHHYLYFFASENDFAQIAYLDLEGEYKASYSDSKDTSLELLPSEVDFQRPPVTKFSVAIDDALVYVWINQNHYSIIENYTPKADFSNWTITKSFPVRLVEGDHVMFYCQDYGGSTRFFHATIGWYNKRGFPELLNTSLTNDWSVEGMPDIKNSKAPLVYSVLKEYNNYNPLDMTAEPLWNDQPFDSKYLRIWTILKPKIDDCVIYVTAATNFISVQVGSKLLDSSSFGNASKVEHVKVFRKSDFGACPKSGSKVIFKYNTSTSSQNAKIKNYYVWNNFNLKNNLYNSGFLSAVISYVNSNNKVVTVMTGMEGWICNDSKAKVHPPQSHYRNEYTLTTTFNARAIYPSISSTTNECSITLE